MFPTRPDNVTEFGYAGRGRTTRRSRRPGWSPSASAPRTPSWRPRRSVGRTPPSRNWPAPSTPGLEPEWLVLADRNFYGFIDWTAARRRRGAAVVAGRGVGDAAAAPRPPGRLLRLGGVQAVDRTGRPEAVDRGRPSRGGPRPHPGGRGAGDRVHRARPHRRRLDRPDRADHDHHRPDAGSGRPAGRGLSPAVGTRDRQRPAQDPPARARARFCGRASPTPSARRSTATC